MTPVLQHSRLGYKGTTAERELTVPPEIGAFWFSTDDLTMAYWDGAVWKLFDYGAGTIGQLAEWVAGNGLGDSTFMSASFSLQVLDQNGTLLNILNGDLVPHLTPSQITGLINLMNALRAKAIDEIL